MEIALTNEIKQDNNSLNNEIIAVEVISANIYLNLLFTFEQHVL
jgi:hypothetical protein